MKVLLLGLGSIGTRHYSNLRSMYPGCMIVTADPNVNPNTGTRNSGIHYSDWRVALHENTSADFCIIASPSSEHLSQMQACLGANIPFFVEKPPCLITQVDAFASVVEQCQERGLPCTVGFCYRYHPVASHRALLLGKDITLAAEDALVTRYGLTCAETMGSHAVDFALWALGACKRSNLHTDGERIWGTTEHEGGRTCHYVLDMDAPAGIKTSCVIIEDLEMTLHFVPYAEMYVSELRQYVEWVVLDQMGDDRLATLDQGLQVMKVLASVNHLRR